MPFNYLPPLHQPNETKIALLILDGLGGLPIQPGGKTELETANTPVMDRLAAEGTLGQIVPIRPGITPGSGPAHLALFGYDPIQYMVGRGALSASGVGIKIKPGDIAVRGNFCSLDSSGKITDRRAGRISTETALPLVEKLNQITLPDVEIEVKVVKEYRFTVVIRGENLHAEIEDTDPQTTGVPPLKVTAIEPHAEATAAIFQDFVDAANAELADQPQANGITLRGFATNPGLPQFQEIYGLDPACVAVYPMYRGVSHLVGMDVIQFDGEYPTDEFAATAKHWDQHNFFFIHIKKTDSMGEDGNFDGKVKIIESVDQALEQLLALKPDVLVITGDHSTPAKMRAHSWHPVPLLLWAPETHLADTQTTFGERACAQGGLGTFPATDIIPLMLGHAGKLTKYGA
ncbi:MAG: 2,3-bisphosphoglycerate-independent phosphoglycerate mutase [Chloroflexota bacterium]